VSAFGLECVVPVLLALCTNSYYILSAMCRGWDEGDMEIGIQEIECSVDSG